MQMVDSPNILNSQAQQHNTNTEQKTTDKIC